MKNLFTTFLTFSGFIFSLQAQVPPILEGTYDSPKVNIIQTDHDTSYRIAYVDGNTIKVEYPDGTLEKTVNLDINHIPCQGCTKWEVFDLRLSSQRIFMADEGYEYMVMLTALDSAGYGMSSVRVFNDNGISILTVDGGQFQTHYPKVLGTRTGGKEKTLVVVPTSFIVNGTSKDGTSIYSTEGWISNPVGVFKRENSKEWSLGNAYPNPSQTTVSIPYSISANENTILTIITIDGRVVKDFVLDPNYNIIEFAEGELASGVYLYTLTSNNKVISTKKMVIN